MGDAIEAAASSPAACYLVSGDDEGEPIQGETSIGGTTIGKANTCQTGGWGLAPVPYDGTYGARAFPAAAALKVGSDSVCELENNPLPLVRVADDKAAAAEAAKARTVSRGETPLCPPNENMPQCPSEWHYPDPIPDGWKKYPGISSVFHCSFRGMVADCRRPDSEHLQQECFYEQGQLVRKHPCAGTPNADDPSEGPIHFISHIFTEGGIIQDGPMGLAGTIWSDDGEQHETENETDPPDGSDRL